MTFEQLYYFTEVYRLNSITLAANHLYISRQTLSSIIKKLEQEFEITLFIRSKIGVKPTEAGNALYQSAQNILIEQSILNQNMQYYAQLSEHSVLPSKKELIDIDICPSLLHVYGVDLSEKLFTLYPHTYFNVFSSTQKAVTGYYKNRDITLTVIPEVEFQEYQIGLQTPFVLRTITNFPLYIWISKSCPLMNEPEISYNVIKKYPFCTLKGILNGPGMAAHMKYDLFNSSSYIDIELPKNFFDYIHKFHYYTTDIPLNHGQLFHRDLFDKTSDITLRKTSEVFLLIMIFNKLTSQDYYPVITDFFNRQK